jgi:hypothetical protein
VNAFALANDTESKVKFYLDQRIVDTEKVLAHPMQNTATTEIGSGDLVRFLEHYEKQINVVTFGGAATEEAAKKVEEEKKEEHKGETKLGLTAKKSQNFA